MGLWERQNVLKNGKEVTYNKVDCQVQSTIHQFVRLRFPWIKKLSYHCTALVKTLQNYKLKLRYHMVSWEPPHE